VEQNYEEAVKWYRLAAEQGNVDAQYNLGCSYEDGEGVEQNHEEAIKWYRLAAEQGEEDAKEALARLQDE
jgi:TPR repeat protein